MIAQLLTFCCLLTFILISCSNPLEKQDHLTLDQTEDYLRILYDDRPVLDYRLTSGIPDTLPRHYVRTGFFHPIWSPEGKIITDDYPVGYAHQHGLFTAWTNTTFQDSFVDFWNTQKGLAFVLNKEITEVQRQDGFLGFKANLTHCSMAHAPHNRERAQPVLTEALTVRVHDRTKPFVWDIRSEQTNVTKDTLFLNEHLYGGLGIRGSKQWNKADSSHYFAPAQFLTSAGLGLEAANHTRPAWTAIFGDLPQGAAGMVVLPHPENFRWPVPVRVHPTLPYFSVSPVVEEGFYIAPAETYLSRYRVIVFDGEPQPELIDQLGWAN
ncbi:MAG: PmoA family protein [Bacteroidota bacterium]